MRKRKHMCMIMGVTFITIFLTGCQAALANNDAHANPIGNLHPSIYEIQYFFTNSIAYAYYPNGDLWQLDEYGDTVEGLSSPQTNKIMSDVKLILEGEAILKKDGSLWIMTGFLDDSSAPKIESHKIMDDVEMIYDFSSITLAIKKDGTLWSFSGARQCTNKILLDTPTKILDNVVSIHDKRIAELSNGDLYLLIEAKKRDTRLEDYEAFITCKPEKLPENNFKELLDNYLITKNKAYYIDSNFNNESTTEFIFITDMNEIKQIQKLEGEIYFLKSDGAVWMFDILESPQFYKILDNVERLYSDYFYMKNGSYMDSYKNSVIPQITQDILEEVKIDGEEFLITTDNKLYLKKTLSGEAKRNYILATDVLYAQQIETSMFTLFYAIKTDNSLWFLGELYPDGVTQISKEIKIADRVFDFRQVDSLLYVTKENGTIDVAKLDFEAVDLGNIEKFVDSIVSQYATLDFRTAVSYGDIPIYLNEKRMTFDVAPFIEGDRTLVPVRVISEELGADVSWNAGKVSIKKNDINIELEIGSQEAYVNGEKAMLDAGALLKDGRTFVPLRFIAEAFSFEVKWEDDAVLLIAG